MPNPLKSGSGKKTSNGSTGVNTGGGGGGGGKITVPFSEDTVRYWVNYGMDNRRGVGYQLSQNRGKKPTQERVVGMGTN